MPTDLISSGKDLIGFSGGTGFDVMNTLTILGVILFFGIIAAVVTLWIVMSRQYKITIVKWERVNGRFQQVGKDKAKSVPVGNGGDSALLLKKHKKMLPTPVIQTGINTFWYFVSDDGEWMNFGPGDFDKDRREMGAHMLDREMRYARTSLQQMSKERYEQASFLQKYGGMLAYAALIIVTAVGFFLIVREMATTSQAASSAVEAAKDVLKETARILGALDNIKGGSGITPA